MNNYIITTTFADKGHFILLSIVKRYQEDDTSSYYDEELLLFSKNFSSYEEVRDFTQTAFFKTVFAATVKTN